MSNNPVKRISSSFNAQQILYLERLAQIDGIKTTTYVTNLVVNDIKDAIRSGRLAVNLPSLERRHLIMVKFVRYLFLMNLQLEYASKVSENTEKNMPEENIISDADLLTLEELSYVASSIDIDVELFKKVFFE